MMSKNARMPTDREVKFELTKNMNKKKRNAYFRQFRSESGFNTGTRTMDTSNKKQLDRMFREECRQYLDI